MIILSRFAYLIFSPGTRQVVYNCAKHDAPCPFNSGKDRQHRPESAITFFRPLPKGKVRVVVKSLEKVSKRPVLDVLSDIHKKQNARGHTPPMREQIDTYLQAERDSWND